MTKLESLKDIKDTAVRLMATLVVDESIRMAEKELQQLVDRFYWENEEMVATQQYEMAKKDFEYFMEDSGSGGVVLSG